MTSWTHLRFDRSGATARPVGSGSGAGSLTVAFPPESISPLREAVLRDGAPRPACLRVQSGEKDTDASVRWLQGVFIAAETLGGPPGELDFTGTDVSSAREALLAAREQRHTARDEAARLRELIANVTDLVTTVSAEGIVTYANPAVERVLGYAAEELVGDSMFERVHPDDQEAVREAMEAVRRDPDSPQQVDVRVRHGDGRWIRVEARGLQVGDPESGEVVVLSRDVTERWEAERALEQALEKYNIFFDLIPVGVVLSDPETGKMHEVNDRFREIFGYEEAEVLGRRSLELDMWEDPEHREVLVERVLEEGGIQSEEGWFRTRDGDRRRMMLSCRRLVLGGQDRLLWAVGDITEIRSREKALARSEERYRALFEDSVDPVVLTTPGGQFVATNAAFTEQFGYEATELAGMDVSEIYEDPAAREVFLETIEEQGVVHDLEQKFRTRTGETRIVRVGARAHRSAEGDIDYIQGVLHDVTELKRMEDRLRHRALHDPLTDVANRDLLWERIRGALTRSTRSGEAVAVAVVDLNRFKRVNDSLGHSAGDRVLVEVAARLQQTLREQDTVARIGGDEFALLLEGLEGELAVRGALERVQRELTRPYEVAGETVRLEHAMGVALHVPDGDLAVREPEDLIRYADLAMYRVKDEDGSKVSFYRPGADHERTTVVRREHELRDAIESGDVVPYFQPILELASGQIIGFEALARWQHPERGTESPADFLPLAEESGLIVPLGYAVIERALAALADWNGEREAGEELSLYVNASVRQIAELEMADRLAEMAGEHGVDPGLMTVEVTETGLMRGRGQADRLVDRGFRLAIDDFGTGYASLAYLKLIDVDVLKIDRSFVSGLGRHPADSAIVETVITLGRSLEIDVLAEGVETEGQLRRLRELRCRLGQGFYFGRPTPADAVPGLMASLRTTAG